MNYFDFKRLTNTVERAMIDAVENEWANGDAVDKTLIATQLAVEAAADTVKTGAVLLVNVPIGVTRFGYKAAKRAVTRQKIKVYDESGQPIEAELVK